MLNTFTAKKLYQKQAGIPESITTRQAAIEDFSVTRYGSATGI